MSNEITPYGEIGLLVDARPVQMPQRTTLTGRYVTLVPLNSEAHAHALYPRFHGSDHERLWLYMWDGPYPDFDSFQEAMGQKAASLDRVFFTILNAQQEPVGIVSYLNIDTTHRTIEVGNVLFAPELQRTPAATEAIYLLTRHVFDDLGYRRYEWKCHALNKPSRRAALRYGFQFEGIFRQHLIIKGRSRDTAWFSMLDSEWPARKAAFDQWLDPANFDETGRQRVALSTLNKKSE